jgi:hypothetical protein
MKKIISFIFILLFSANISASGTSVSVSVRVVTNTVNLTENITLILLKPCEGILAYNQKEEKIPFIENKVFVPREINLESQQTIRCRENKNLEFLVFFVDGIKTEIPNPMYREYVKNE